MTCGGNYGYKHGAESMILSACVESMILSVHAESIILSAPPTESMILSARIESIILSAHYAESMILSAPFGRVIMLTLAATKKTISDTDNCRFMTLVNSASMALLIGLPPKGAKFCLKHIVSGASMLTCSIDAVF
jgi:hypothetical protein